MKRKIVTAIRSALLVPPFFLLTILYAGVVLVVGRRDRDAPLLSKVISSWSRLFLKIPPLTYTVEGAANAEPGQQYVVVTNHLSNFDIPLVLETVPGKVRFLAKKELFKIPVFGPAMELIGVVKIDRTAGMSVHDAIFAASAESLGRGNSLLVFAEGTRSRDGEMARFKRGAFRIAIENQFPLLPVVLEGTFEVNPPDSMLVYPGKAQVSILEPIDTTGLERRDIPELSKRVQAMMMEEYDRLRAR